MADFIKCALYILGAFFVGYMYGRSIGWWDHAEYIESIKKGEIL